MSGRAIYILCEERTKSGKEEKSNEGVLDECGYEEAKERSKWKPGKDFMISVN